MKRHRTNARTPTRQTRFVRAQKEHADALSAEQQRLIDGLRFKIGRLQEATGRVFGISVAYRLTAIRQKQRAIVGRLLATKPVNPHDHAPSSSSEVAAQTASPEEREPTDEMK